jgi:photosystem II stability/assembly factor-like uncharacterized protein
MKSSGRIHRGLIVFALFALCGAEVRAQKGEWVAISDGVTSQLKADGKKIGYPGLTAGVTVDPSSGDVYMVVCDQGLWKSSDAGKTFTRVDGGKIGGRCETGYALNFDPAGKRLACFMIYGPCASTADAGETWLPWKTNHLDFGVVDWEGTGQTILATRHESGGVLCMSTDGGKAWQDLGRAGPDKKIVKEDREFKALGIFDAKALVASRGKGIVRSTDAGRTWETVSDATPVAAVMVVRKGVGYWLTDRGVMTSKDRGETWSEGWRIKAVFGPYFGAKEGHVVVVGKEGFSESLDGGARWKVVAPLPPAFNTNRVGPNYAWDSLHDIFYASSMGKPTYRFER